jgi:hypothetical protein
MRRLLVLWDPENPLTPVGPVLEAMGEETRVTPLTFENVSHRTMPNKAFRVAKYVEQEKVDGVLWIEGGPLPGDLEEIRCPKACWIPNAHLEPTLLDDLSGLFDRVMVGSLALTADERAKWLPLSASTGLPPAPPEGISVLLEDPKPAAQALVEWKLREVVAQLPALKYPIVLCLGQGSQAHPMLFECLRTGAVVLAGGETDLRGIAHIGEHVDVFPSAEGLGVFLRTLIHDNERLGRLATRGAQIVEHLHTPGLRARDLLRAVWPSEEVLGGREHEPEMSVLVTCHRYLKRFRFCLESLARQDLPPGALEIVVSDPESPDGLAQHLRDFSRKYPGLRVVRLPLEARYHRNRGVGINRAFDVSSGQVIVSIDGDIVFPPHLIRTLAERVREAPRFVYGIKRSFLSKAFTERVLSGEMDPFAHFEELAQSEGDGEEKPFVGVLGYCQAVSRMAFARARYPEEFDMVNQSDIDFVERLGRHAQVRPKFLEGETALHLWHPRNWMGTSELL